MNHREVPLVAIADTCIPAVIIINVHIPAKTFKNGIGDSHDLFSCN